MRLSYKDQPINPAPSQNRKKLTKRLCGQNAEFKVAGTRHTQKNGAVSKEFTIDIAPFFYVCPVYTLSTVL